LKTVDLLNYPYPALILPYPSGIMIKQQVAGLATEHRSVEGIFLPLPVPAHRLKLFMSALEAIHPGCYSEVTWDEACKLDDVLKQYNIPVDVNKGKRKESTESWVYVRLFGKDDKWPLKPSSDSSYIKFAKKIKPDVTDAEIEAAYSWRIFVNLDMLADFAGQEAILTWENCD
jgi:hypothetical protein